MKYPTVIDVGLAGVACCFLFLARTTHSIALYFIPLGLITARTWMLYRAFIRAETEAAAKKQRPTLWHWVMSLALALTCLFLLPDLSDDYHRYLWEGFVGNEGFSPYHHSPESLYDTLDHPSEGKVNHADLTAIYPPLAQWIFRLTAALGTSLVPWKTILLLGLLATFYFKDQRESMLWLSSPLVLFEGLWNTHLDLLGLLGISLFCLSISRRLPGRAGIVLGLMAGYKIMPIILAPFCLKHFREKDRWQFLIGLGVALAVCFGPYIPQWQQVFDSFRTFSNSFHFNNLIYNGLAWLMGKDPARAVLTVCLVVSLVVIWWRSGPLTWQLPAAWIALVIFSPTFYPWYLLWLLPLLPKTRAPWLHLAYAASFLSYLVLIPYRAKGLWLEQLWWMIPEWALLVFFLSKAIGWNIKDSVWQNESSAA